MKQPEIDAVAASIRAAGIPDSLNRWIGMTPDRLDELRDRASRIAISERTIDMPRTGAGPKIGPKEQAQRDLRARNLAAEERTPKTNHGMAPEKRKALLQSLAADAAAKHPKPEASAPARTKEPKTMIAIKTNSAVPTNSKAVAAAVAALAGADGSTPPAAPKPEKPAEPKKPEKPAAKKPAPKPAAKAKAKPAKKTAAKPAKKTPAAKKPAAAKKAGGETKSDIVHRMLTAANGTTRELLSKATDWPSVNLTVATARAQKLDPKFRLVEENDRVRLTTAPK